MTPRMARERRMSAASRSNGAARRSRKAAYFVVCVCVWEGRDFVWMKWMGMESITSYSTHAHLHQRLP